MATDTGAATAALPGGAGLVVLDTAVTPELAAEGVARDVLRAVQQARREAGLEVSDRINLALFSSDEVLDAVRAHESFVAEESLADNVSYGPLDQAPEDAFEGTVTDNGPVRVRVERA